MRRMLALLLLMVLHPAGLSAQRASGGGFMQEYRMTGAGNLRVRSIRLATLPFSGHVPLCPGVGVAVGGAFAHAAVRLDHAVEERVSGWMDTRVSIQLQNDRLLFVASALIPTGEVVRDLGEATVVGLLTTDLMPFAVSQWGTGGGFAGDVTYALYGSDIALRLTAGGTRFGTSNPMESTLAYRPAWRVSGRAALEAAAGPASVVSMVVGVQQFGVDTYATRNLFRPGMRIDGVISYAFPLGPRASAVAYGSTLHVVRGRSEVEPRFLADLNPAFSGIQSSASRTLVRVGGEMRLTRGPYDLAPRAEVRVLRRGDGIGQGWLTTFGTGGGFRLQGAPDGRSVRAEPTIALRFGRWVGAGGMRSWIVGWEAGLALRWGGGR